MGINPRIQWLQHSYVPEGILEGRTILSNIWRLQPRQFKTDQGGNSRREMKQISRKNQGQKKSTAFDVVWDQYRTKLPAQTFWRLGARENQKSSFCNLKRAAFAFTRLLPVNPQEISLWIHKRSAIYNKRALADTKYQPSWQRGRPSDNVTTCKQRLRAICMEDRKGEQRWCEKSFRTRPPTSHEQSKRGQEKSFHVKNDAMSQLQANHEHIKSRRRE